MYNKTSPVREYLTNLALINIAMEEIIHQLEGIVIEDEKKDKNTKSSSVFQFKKNL